MDINKIEIILCALRLGSFSKAAEIYSYTPSALTHIADSLEDEIGTKFIKRTHSGIEPLDQEIINGLQEICDTKNRICAISGGGNRLTVGTYSSASKFLLPKIVKGFQSVRPDIHVDIKVVNSFSELLDGGADVLFGARQSAEDYWWTEIMTDPYFAIFPDHRTTPNDFSFDRKYNETFIITDETVVVERIRRENFDSITLVTAHDDSSVIEMVKADMGIAVLPQLSVSESRGIKTVPLSPSVSRTLGLSYKKHSANKKLIREFVDFFASYVKEPH